MKRCTECGKEYTDEGLFYCLDDGARLSTATAELPDPPTIIMGGNFGAAPQPLTRPLSGGPFAPTVSMTGFRANSVTVLPFAHLSSDPDDEYFCDGLAEELINALGKLDDVKVVGRTSAFALSSERE